MFLFSDKTEINLRRAYEAFQASDSPFVQDYRELLKKNSGNKPVLDELLHKVRPMNHLPICY